MEVATSEIRIRHKISADCIGAKREFHPQNAPPTQAGFGGVAAEVRRQQ
jgi:hypothetical protein